ncbi:MAG: hypothetical protein ACRC3H_19620 [Lachnospiraceae bacterium]
MNKEQRIEKCAKCEYVKIISGGGNWTFPGCYHRPHRGKWCAEVESCPKDIKNANVEMA